MNAFSKSPAKAFKFGSSKPGSDSEDLSAQEEPLRQPDKNRKDGEQMRDYRKQIDKKIQRFEKEQRKRRKKKEKAAAAVAEADEKYDYIGFI